MANSPSSKKRALQAARRADINKARRSRMRTFIRKVEEAIATGDKAAAAEALRARPARDHDERQQGRRPQEHRQPQDFPPRRPGEGARRLTLSIAGLSGRACRARPLRVRTSRGVTSAVVARKLWRNTALGLSPRPAHVPPSVRLSGSRGLRYVGVTGRFLTASTPSNSPCTSA